MYFSVNTTCESDWDSDYIASIKDMSTLQVLLAASQIKKPEKPILSMISQYLPVRKIK